MESGLGYGGRPAEFVRDDGRAPWLRTEDSMRVVLQRVREASVTVEGRVTGDIGRGFLVLAGIGREDNEATLLAIANKIVNLRVFEDDKGRMNRSLLETGGRSAVGCVTETGRIVGDGWGTASVVAATGRDVSSPAGTGTRPNSHVSIRYTM